VVTRPRSGRTSVTRQGARAPEAYQYLIESIRRFPEQRAFAEQIERAGFVDMSFRNLSFGIACIHVGTRAAAHVPGAADAGNDPWL
jgi:ubiquinone/menaquinone biosynthesis C-methylase UbiE